MSSDGRGDIGSLKAIHTLGEGGDLEVIWRGARLLFFWVAVQKETNSSLACSLFGGNDRMTLDLMNHTRGRCVKGIGKVESSFSGSDVEMGQNVVTQIVDRFNMRAYPLVH